MQGVNAVTEVVDALARLDRDPEVDVIVIARGGGSVEDLLPFSNETMVRAVSDGAHPGRQRDRARDRHPDARSRRRPGRVDPDRRGEADRARPRRRAARGRPSCARGRAAAIQTRIERETELMAGLPAAPARRPSGSVSPASRSRTRRGARPGPPPHRDPRRERAGPTSSTSAPGVRALSPQATLDRGYAVVRRTGRRGRAHARRRHRHAARPGRRRRVRRHRPDAK